MSTMGQGQSEPGSIRDRCRELGLPTWRCDSGGAIAEEPAETGLAGLWLRSGHVGSLVSAAARDWLRQPRTGPSAVV